MLSNGYGGGHGVEFYDITDPADPEYISSLKTPPHFGGVDSWRVFTAGDLCYFADSMGGLFEIDLSDIGNPRFTRHFRLPVKEKQRQTPPSIQLICGDVTGVALLGDHLCVAGEDGIYILDRQGCRGAAVCGLQKPSARVNLRLPTPEYANPDVEVIAKSGQMHSFVSIEGDLLCAAGNAGIVSVRSGRSLTGTICCDIARFNDLFIAAEMDAGIVAYCYENGCLTLLDRMETEPASPAREVVSFGRYLLVQLGISTVLPITFDGHLAKAGKPLAVGMLYHRHIARTPAGSYPIVLSLKVGPELIIPGENGLDRSDYRLGHETCPIEEGGCGYGDGMIVVFNRGYYYLENPMNLVNLPAQITCEGARLNGLPFVCEKNSPCSTV